MPGDGAAASLLGIVRQKSFESKEKKGCQPHIPRIGMSICPDKSPICQEK
jgi:hypothetical protein